MTIRQNCYNRFDIFDKDGNYVHTFEDYDDALDFVRYYGNN